MVKEVLKSFTRAEKATLHVVALYYEVNSSIQGFTSIKRCKIISIKLKTLFQQVSFKIKSILFYNFNYFVSCLVVQWQTISMY